MRRRFAAIALALITAVAGTVTPAAATTDARARTVLGVVGQIVPGSVNRSSYLLEASYDATIRIGWTSRAIRVDSTATIRNTSGASIDRLELNTAAARLGELSLSGVSVDGAAVKATVSDQTIVVPLGGILPAGASTSVRVRYAARLRTSTTSSSWMFAKANGIINLYRWLPWVSKRVNFYRPNFGDPFVTPTSPFVRVRIVPDRRLVFATSGGRVALDGLEQVYEARNVRDFTITAAPDFVTRTTTVGATKVMGYARSAAVAARLRDEGARALGRLRSLLGAYPYSTYRVVESAGGAAMESPALSWIPYGTASSRLRYLVTHETAHQWFYSLVGSDQVKEPFTDEAAADFVTRYALGSKRGSTCSKARLDLSIYQYSRACYYEIVYIQGGNVLDWVRTQMGSTAFWTALRGYIADHRHEIVSTQTLLDALDDATPLNLARPFERRFPRIY